MDNIVLCVAVDHLEDFQYFTEKDFPDAIKEFLKTKDKKNWGSVFWIDTINKKIKVIK